MFSSLSVRNFRVYWLGMMVSLTGTWIQQVAQSWLVFDLTKSAFLLGFVGFLSSLPVLLFSLFGGVLADRVNKRNILIATQIIFMSLAFFLGLFTQLKIITTTQIMLFAFLNGMVMAFDGPARQSIVVELVGKKHLFNAIALNSVSFNSSRVIGPSLAGVLFATIGMSGCFYINAISFLAVIFALFSIKASCVSRGPDNNSAVKDLKDGLIFIRNNRLILVLIFMVGVVSLFGVSYIILMPIFANDVLGVGVRGLGILMSASGAGALFGALILARLGEFRHKGKLLVISAMLFSLSLLIFALSRNFILSIAVLCLLGFTSVTAVALVNTILQISVEDRYRGRVMSIFMITFAGMMPFGHLLAGSLAYFRGVSFAVFTGGAICALFFAALFIRFKGILKIR